MKWIEKLTPSPRLAPPIATALALALVVAVNACAQDVDTTKSKSTSSISSSNEEKDSTVHQRFWAGIYGSGTPLRMTSTHDYTDANGDAFTSTKAGGIVGGGVNLNLRITKNYWLNLGAVYHFAGFDTIDTVNDSNNTVYTTRYRSHMFDFPLLVRYAGPKFRWSKYSFYELGGVGRYATSPQISGTASDDNGSYCCAPPPGVNFKRFIPGVSVGTGLVAKDDFGIKVAPEVRYIRWFGDTFHSTTVGTMRDQLEIGISFGF